MADDQQNPFTLMGMTQMMMPNPYSIKGKLPIPGFRGPATDAQGRPIQSFTDAQAAHDAWDAAHPATPAQGTTLNSTPAGLEPLGSSARAMQNAGYGDWALLDPMMAHSSIPGQMGGEGSVAATKGWNPINPASATGVGGTAGTAGAAQPAATNPVDMRQAYLDALANPGKVTTPGATIQPSKPLGTPNVLDAFLANHPSGPAAPAGGGYNNKPFFDTLSQLRSTG